jgi:preprotein translocase subunit SecA
MDYLKEGISLRSYGQRDPLVEYQREAFDLFTALLDAIKEESVGYLFNLEVRTVDEAAATGQVLDVSPAPADAPGIAAAPAAEQPPLPSEEHRAVAEVLGLRQPKQPERLNYSAPNPDAGTGVVHGQTPARSTGTNPAADQEISRNAPCPCGSGRKYKRCHGAPGGGA